MKKTNTKIARNVSVPKPVGAKEVERIANSMIFLREFNPDYDQIVLRVSSAVTEGLRFGSPWPPVGF